MKELIQIQSELKAPKSQFNAFGKYNYRSCEDILEAVKPLLLKYGCTLTIHDEVKEIAGIPFIESTASIQSDSESRQVTAQAGIDPNRKGMDIAQCFGASSSYARKYALNGLFLIDDTKDPDSTNDHSPKPAFVAPKPASVQPKPLKTVELEVFTEDKWKEFMVWLPKNKSLGLAEILKRLGLKYEITQETKTRIENELKS
jgi:hypothetical protein